MGTPIVRALACAALISLALPLGAQRLAIQEKPSQDGVSLSVDSSPRGATVYLNGERVGTTPVSLSGFPPGSYRLELSLDGYKGRIIELNAVDGTLYIVMAELEPRRGLLRVEVSPPGAEILIDGRERAAGIHVLRVGRHRIEARLFGYRTQSREAYVSESFPGFLSFELEKAPFEAEGASFSKPRFDPSAPGALGRTVFTFRVSAPGSGRLSVIAPSGETVSEKDFAFETWGQSFGWDGRGSGGERLEDGEYRFSLEALGDDGTAASLSRAVRIDSSARIEPRSLASGVPGYALCPSPSILPERYAEIGTGISFPLLGSYAAAALPLWSGMRASITRPVQVFASFHGSAGPGADSGIAFNGGLGWRFAERAGASGFEAAAFAQLSAAMPGPLPILPLAEDGTALRLGFPLGFASGPFDAILSPALFAAFPPGARALFGADLSAALGLQAPFGDVHLSANAKYRFGAAFEGPLRAAVDARFIPGFAPCSLGAGFGLDIGLDGSLSPSLSLGLSLLI